jgi:hypothetical protein
MARYAVDRRMRILDRGVGMRGVPTGRWPRAGKVDGWAGSGDGGMPESRKKVMMLTY